VQACEDFLAAGGMPTAGTKALIGKALRRSARVVVTDGMPVHQLLVLCFFIIK
jgi:hypothetical protein